MKAYDYIIWDFNGTILDDVDTGIKSVNKLLFDRGLATIPDVEYYRSVFRFPIIDYYRSLGFDFESEPYEVLAPQWVSLYLEYVKDATVYADVRSTLRSVRKLGVGQIILSATELDMLKGQIDELGIGEYFEEILGLDNIHAGSKLSLAFDWRDRHKGARALLVGDTDHDVQTAKALQADCVLVARGHQSKEYLSTLGVPVFDDLSQLISML
ncbi:MAG: HAD family hydrolase [Ruminococcaceae bacterium]|nr:HAD family hydrolase [Oscillospiraceae bacterium]